MNVTKSMPIAYAVSVVLTAVIFTIDLNTPQGTAEWLGYILPLLVSALFLRRRYILVLTSACSLLIVLAFYLTPMGIEHHGALFSRILGIVVIWITAILLLQRKRADEEIKNLNAVMAHRASELEEVNRDLEKLNRTMEERIRREVLLNREKDFTLSMQSRQAAMGEMINNIAHQWRQPLFALELFIQDIRACHESGLLTAEYLDAAVTKSVNAIRQMSQTIDDFMNFLKPNKAKTPFSVKEAIRQALSFIEWGAGRPGITLDCEEGDDILVTGFPNEYCQVLLNIFHNAREALAERRVALPRLNIRLFRNNGSSVVTITDNAGGIPAEIIGKIFDPYFTTREEEKGSGIGLYMSRMIIERHMNGRLSVSNTGEGAEFRIEV
jgi:signal transduction histidine kinase